MWSTTKALYRGGNKLPLGWIANFWLNGYTILEVLMKMEGFKKDNLVIVLTMWQLGFEQAHKSCNKQ